MVGRRYRGSLIAALIVVKATLMPGVGSEGRDGSRRFAAAQVTVQEESDQGDDGDDHEVVKFA